MSRIHKRTSHHARVHSNTRGVVEPKQNIYKPTWDDLFRQFPPQSMQEMMDIKPMGERNGK